MVPIRRRLLAAAAAMAAFGLVIVAAVAAVPYLFGLLYGCFPPSGSCGDGVGWAMLISSPVTMLPTVVVASVIAYAVYARILRMSFGS